MAEQHLITAEFFGAPVSILDHAGKQWLTAEQAGRCLGYSEKTARQSINNLFNKHADEFGDEDTTVIDLMTVTGPKECRIFSAIGCQKLGFFAKTARAKEFRAFAAKVLAGQAPAPVAQTAPAAVSALEANMNQMAQHMGTLAQGMKTVLTQMDVTKKYIGLLETNQAGTRKITPAVAEEVRQLKAEGMNNADIGRLLRISRTAVSLIVRDKYPVEIREPERSTDVGAILENWIEREQKQLAGVIEKLEGCEA